MVDGILLRDFVDGVLPESRAVLWGDLWERPLEEGSAFEWAVTAAVSSAAVRRGWSVSLPTLELPDGPAMFPLRNEIPRHHGARPGHSAADAVPLRDRFLQAFIPKLVLTKGSESLSVFREGCPYHAVSLSGGYNDRPDILFLKGRPTVGYPQLLKRGTVLAFSFDFGGGPTYAGQLRVVNAPHPQILAQGPPLGKGVPVLGVVECSTQKGFAIASEQIDRYVTLFSGAMAVLVTGNKVVGFSFPNRQVEFSAGKERLFSSLASAADLILDSLHIT